jgi:hypothetical protein
VITPGKEPQYPLNSRSGGQPGGFEEEKDLLPVAGFEPWIIQSHSCYTNYTTLAPHLRHTTYIVSTAKEVLDKNF